MLKLSLCDKIKQKGALFVEYAMLLAFVIVVGVFFISDGGIKNSITSIFGKAEDTLEVAVNGGNGKYVSTWAPNSYKELGTQVKMSTSANMIAVLGANGGKISCTDLNGIKALNDAGVSVPADGNGNWLLQSINNGQGYELAWTIEDTTKGGESKKSISYIYSGDGKQPYISVGTASINERGIINSGTTEVEGHYTYQTDMVSFETNYIHAMKLAGYGDKL